MDTEYKELHREAMSNQTGSTLIEIYTSLFPLPIHIIVFIWMSINTDHSKKLNSPTIWMFLFEFITMVLPTVFNFTLFSDYSVVQFLIYIIVFGIAFVWMLLNHNYISSSTIKTKKNPYITVYRFMLNTYTVFCILAVDFNVFPRRFAKTETYGHGVMDIGVGCYVCSNALLFNIPNTRNISKNVFKVFKQVLPLLVLGIGRTYFVTKADYHHYMFEYGVHWNFFMTLAFLKIINLFVLPFISTCCLSIIATILVVIYEFALNFGLAEWIMSDAPRDTLFSANREGILSLIGYEAIFLYTLSMKSRLSFFMKKNHLLNSIFLLTVTSTLSIALFLLTFIISYIFGVSRRLANAGYVYWVLSISSYLLFMSIMIENFLTVLLHKIGRLSEFNRVSLIIDSVNDNLLFFFLFANVVTGIINMCMYTLVMNTVSSIIILSLYMFVIYFTIYISQQYKNKIYV
ncbi:phosphatidylinositol-glycan biosynthesis class W protein-like [Rhopalosiphum padi]|uniref:phosphatidylinositol-glycan biosynthesis class W protein-like n=1 Tax=Rhopalosiphum padi TaxID=40932 RepID=UPI00298E1300|nr:phosphatidylinositol-glycan biosynthesis class W protein-like [Rhopalosiphum padi]XP_060851542.1 phosphatidylinositol-glycan biosynthesis class W protein-like [Rhopalosiphum padi]